MAALTKPGPVELAPLGCLAGHELEALLAEEIRQWRAELEWDFSAAADLVSRFLGMRSLGGLAAVIRGRVVGYCYYILEDHKGLIGDLYVLGEEGAEEIEDMLLRAVLGELTTIPGVRRVESQLILLHRSLERRLPLESCLEVFPREFMLAPLPPPAPLERHPRGHSVLFENWRDDRQPEAAWLIAASYDGHVDSRINDQYRSASGARRFLTNIVQYPGCGSFFQPASFLAFEPAAGEPAGMILSSLVAEETGHVTQVCVPPRARGMGVGYELVRRSLAALQFYGCGAVSLTVTTANRHAVELYRRMGFHTHRRFGAYVWEGF